MCLRLYSVHKSNSSDAQYGIFTSAAACRARDTLFPLPLTLSAKQTAWPNGHCHFPSLYLDATNTMKPHRVSFYIVHQSEEVVASKMLDPSMSRMVDRVLRGVRREIHRGRDTTTIVCTVKLLLQQNTLLPQTLHCFELPHGRSSTWRHDDPTSGPYAGVTRLVTSTACPGHVP